MMRSSSIQQLWRLSVLCVPSMHCSVTAALAVLSLLLTQSSPANCFSLSWFFNDKFYRALDPPNYGEDFMYPDETVQDSNVYDDFRVYWNVPTFQCHKYGYNFTEVGEWGIKQNIADNFRGDQISLLYDPGLFPALLQSGGSARSDFVVRNGGVPHEGNLTKHLQTFSEDIAYRLVPDTQFSGLAVIDFEHWRPMFDENFGTLSSYREYSMDIERQQHPLRPNEIRQKEAMRKFEKAASQFLSRTLQVAKLLRPKAFWGYYGYPFCFNYTPKNNQAKCSQNVIKNNEKAKWLYEESSAIYPSLYYKFEDMNVETRARFMKGRMAEALRVAKMAQTKIPVYPYTWLKYYDTKQFVDKIDLMNSLMIPKKNGASGVIIWGASNDVNSEKKCKAMMNYLTNTLGPTIKEFYKNNKKQLKRRKAKMDNIFNYFIG
ncbi:hyaluronidase-like [Daktulosphaira vitifoliae]|uniref:hyaluronidase-like n=1 Tax=Daktulosphaira vitifoliae TaxID=58002 RepID=UPI0021AAF898|nr:hyaluronidase-like [Daktulosphaira vitifoliae]